jgi:hypothetical protein
MLMLDDLTPGMMFHRCLGEGSHAWLVLSVDANTMMMLVSYHGKNRICTMCKLDFVDAFVCWLDAVLDHEGKDITHEIKERSKRDDDG